jgi:hypothetical protein
VEVEEDPEALVWGESLGKLYGSAAKPIDPSQQSCNQHFLDEVEVLQRVLS